MSANTTPTPLITRAAVKPPLRVEVRHLDMAITCPSHGRVKLDRVKFHHLGAQFHPGPVSG
ncbi:hypothetical protein GCM10009660_22310 [Catellatospora bangladeshensis]